MNLSILNETAIIPFNALQEQPISIGECTGIHIMFSFQNFMTVWLSLILIFILVKIKEKPYVEDFVQMLLAFNIMFFGGMTQKFIAIDSFTGNEHPLLYAVGMIFVLYYISRIVNKTIKYLMKRKKKK